MGPSLPSVRRPATLWGYSHWWNASHPSCAHLCLLVHFFLLVDILVLSPKSYRWGQCPGFYSPAPLASPFLINISWVLYALWFSCVQEFHCAFYPSQLALTGVPWRGSQCRLFPSVPLLTQTQNDSPLSCRQWRPTRSRMKSIQPPWSFVMASLFQTLLFYSIFLHPGNTQPRLSPVFPFPERLLSTFSMDCELSSPLVRLLPPCVRCSRQGRGAWLNFLPISRLPAVSFLLCFFTWRSH